MSRHRFRIFIAAVLSAAFLIASVRADRIAGSIKSSSSPANTRAAIQNVLNPLVKNLESDNADVQKDARVALIFESESHAGATASPQYESEYVRDLSKALASAASSPNLRVRMNAAIVTREVAEKIFRGGGDASVLADLDRSFLNDKDVAVVLWGVKAAKYVLASQLQNGGNAVALAKELVKAVEAHGESGPIVEEAYSTLTFYKFDKFNGAGNPSFASEAVVVLPNLLDLIAWRTKDYQNGAVPPSSEAEKPLSVFISVNIYSALASNPALRDRTLKVMGQMTCAVMQTIANGNGTPDLVDIAKDYGKAFEAFGTLMGNAGIRLAGKGVSDIGINTYASKITALCQGLDVALKAVGVNMGEGDAAGAAENPAAPALAGTPR